ncbi:MAG: hypothetical protein U9R72_15860 [Chloroflexota bacterium]|nr:hypothetical protein [Chloroflexota bacterium]
MTAEGGGENEREGYWDRNAVEVKTMKVELKLPRDLLGALEVPRTRMEARLRE